ncbi:MAG TPA: ATP-binding protein [Burkholderiaceae bacterium]
MDWPPMYRSPGLPEVVATALAVVAVLLWALWRRKRHAWLLWATAGYALAAATAMGWPAPVPAELALLPRALIAWAIAGYLGQRGTIKATLVGPAFVLAAAPPTFAVWAAPCLDFSLGVLCAVQARREPGSGHGLLAAAALAGAAWLACAALSGADAARIQLAALGPAALALAMVLPVAVMLREDRHSRSAHTLMQRMTHFYDALSRTNQAIARVKERTQLFEAICEICVDAGHARMACVYVLDGALAHRAATAGPAAEILSGIPQPWDTSEPKAQGSYTVQALHGGHPITSNDYQNDPRAAPWRDQAIAHGVHAFAWLPFHRRGGVDGVLMLAAGHTGFFDDPLMKLLGKMVGDISLALDAIDHELERERAQREAQASLARFQLLFNAAPAASSIISIAQRRVLAVNDACCAAYGLTREQILGHRTAELAARLSEEDREDFYAELKRHGRVRNRVFRVHRVDAKPTHELFNAEPIEYMGEACLLVMSLNITDLHEAEQVREALARAESASRAKTEFLSRMSHELRTPLNAVLGFAELLRHEAQERLTPQELAQLDLLQQAGWHLLTLINDVLDVSRIEAGHLMVQTGPLALLPLLDEVMEMTRGGADKRAVSLVRGYDSGAPVAVRADPTRLRQVLLNLLSNAVKYNRPGGVVKVALRVESEWIHLLIEDTGLGMTREQLSHLFEPFNRLGRERGAIEGTGIGLVLARQLVRLMQGDIEVESKVGVGTRLSVSLPRIEVVPRAPEPPWAQPALVAPRGTVLYVEDNDVNAVLVEQILARWADVRFVRAHDGASGVDLARSVRPDLLLLDMQLPDIDGLEVLRRVKADAATRHLRVVALSASAMPDEVARARQLGADEYWTKPLALDRFLADVARLMGKAATDPEAIAACPETTKPA